MIKNHPHKPEENLNNYRDISRSTRGKGVKGGGEKVIMAHAEFD
jgi:hypothetical protein